MCGRPMSRNVKIRQPIPRRDLPLILVRTKVKTRVEATADVIHIDQTSKSIAHVVCDEHRQVSTMETYRLSEKGDIGVGPSEWLVWGWSIGWLSIGLDWLLLDNWVSVAASSIAASSIAASGSNGIEAGA